MLRIAFFFVVFLFVAEVTQAQQKSFVAILSRSKQDGIWLRWAPTSATYWKLGNKYGYTLERFTLKPDGDMEADSRVTLSTSPIKPYTPAEFLPLSEKSDEAATLEELLYGEKSKTTFSGNDISSVLTKNNELENQYGIAMLMCDLSLDAATAGGLFFKDPKAVKGKRYIYRISLATNPTGQAIEPSVIIVSAGDEKPLAEIKDLNAEFGDKTVSISWSTLLHKGIYTAYYIERSTDGKSFSKLTDIPYIHMSDKLENETAFYVDSLKDNHTKYFYRIKGVSPFAEVGPHSNIVSGEGKESLFGLLVLRECKALDKKRVSVTWEFPKSLESQINGFMVSRANNPDGVYVDAVNKVIGKEVRQYIDATTFNNTYYILKALDKQGREITRSFPYLVQIEDSTPPAIPIEITGSIEKNGVTKLSWKANTDADLLGYRVFRSNSIQEEPVEVTREILFQSQYTDTINIRVLDKRIFYSVIAVDKNYNTSNYSKTFVLARPDILPPVAPVFTKTELVKDSIILEWVNSVSNDIARYELSRIEKENRISRIVSTWYPSSLVENYKDKSLTTGYTYAYKITAYDSAENKSETLSREILFEPGYRSTITNVKSSVDREAKRINLEWKNSSPSVKCIIYRKINNNPFTIYKTLEGNAESFSDTEISINNSYGYKVQPVFSKGVKALLSEEIKVIY